MFIPYSGRTVSNSKVKIGPDKAIKNVEIKCFEMTKKKIIKKRYTDDQNSLFHIVEGKNRAG